MECCGNTIKDLDGFSVHLNIQLKFYNLPNIKYSNEMALMVEFLKNRFSTIKPVSCYYDHK